MTGETSGSSNEPMVVVAGADERFAIGLAALGVSVIEHRGPKRPLEFHAIDAGLETATRERLTRSWRGDGVAVVWHRLNRERLAALGLAEYSFPLASCVPLVLDRLLPGDLAKVLFLDADMIVLADLEPLWSMDFADGLVAAVQDTMVHHLHHHFVPPEIDASRPLPVFNSGLMLIPLDRWRAEDVCGRAIDFAVRYRRQFWSPDQQGLNCALAGRWTPLPLVWNRMTHVQEIPSHRSTCFDADEFEAALARPSVAHFAGVEKPWMPKCPDDFTPEFFRLLEETEWAGWRPPRRPWFSGLVEDLGRRPHRRYFFVRRGLRAARLEGLSRWPWWGSAVKIAARYPWTAVTFPARRIGNRLLGRGPGS